MGADAPLFGLVEVPELLCLEGVSFLADVGCDLLDGGFLELLTRTRAGVGFF